MFSTILSWIGYFFLFSLIVYIAIFFLIIYKVSPQGQGAVAVDKEKSNQYYYKDEKIVHAMNGNFFSLGSYALENVDKESFEVLADNFAKDKNSVYYNEILLEGVNADTFTLIEFDIYENTKRKSYTYSKDDTRVFFLNNDIVAADVSTFKGLWGNYTEDKNSIYYQGKKIVENNAETSRITDDSKEDYLQINHKTFYRDLEIKGAKEKVIALKDGFSKDERFVYYKTHKILGADVKSFAILDKNYQSDTNTLYYEARSLENSDPKSYERLDTLYSKDAKQVYYIGSILMNVNAQTFTGKDIKEFDSPQKYYTMYYSPTHSIQALRSEIKDLSRQHSLYKDEVYCLNSRIVGSDLESFTVLQDSLYSKDKNHLYSSTNIIKDADSQSFEVLSENFSKDKNSVYYFENKVKNLKPESFVYKEGMYAEEVNNSYELRQ